MVRRGNELGKKQIFLRQWEVGGLMEKVEEGK